MLKKFTACLVFLLWIFSAGTSQAQDEIAAWRPLAQGISYREFYLPEPNRVYVARLDRSNLEASLETSLANGALSSGLESLSGQVERYNQALAYSDGSWGSRYKVIAAINGGFFETESGAPLNGLMHSGWYAKRFEDRQTVGGIAWRSDRQAFIIECIVQPPGKQRVVLVETNQSIPFDGINTTRGKDELILYTPQFGPYTPPADEVIQGFEILVEVDRPLTAYSDTEPVEGTVRGMRDGLGGMSLPFDHFVLSAAGQAAQIMQGNFSEGTRVRIEFEIRHLNQDCRKQRSESLEGVSAAVAGGDIFLREGVIQPLNDLGAVLRNPRSAVALNDQFVFFIVVDGRDKLHSIGMSMVELALFASLRLGATWGVAMDGGGSSTMVIDGAVVNRPNSDTVVRTPPEISPRGVADGLLMVVLQPAEYSSRFTAGDVVTIRPGGDANLRLGPGTNYASVAVITAGIQGTILDHPLNGILAKDNNWWKVSWGEQIGWVSETVLEAGN